MNYKLNTKMVKTEVVSLDTREESWMEKEIKQSDCFILASQDSRKSELTSPVVTASAVGTAQIPAPI